MDLQLSPQKLTVKCTKQGRVTSLVAAVVVFGFDLIPLFGVIFDPQGFRQFGWVLIVCSPLYAALGGWCLYAAGPMELTLDLDNRTYALTRGFPWRPRRWQGTFDEIKGLHFQAGGRYGDIYYVILDWKWQVNRSAVTLFFDTDRARAMAKLEELCATLDLPRDTVW